VEPTPELDVVNNLALVCNGDNVDIDITTPVTTDGAHTLDVEVTRLNSSNTKSTAFIDHAGLTYPFNLTGTLTNTSDHVIEVTFEFAPTPAGGYALSLHDALPICVEPTPELDVVNNLALVCNGDNVDIDITTPVTTDGAHT